MVQLVEDASDSASNSSVAHKPYSEPQPTWPYLILAVAIVLISAGAHQMLYGQGKCPFHFGADTETGSNPHYNPDLYSEVLVFGSKKKLADVYSGRVVTKQELSRHGVGSPDPWVAVLGQVFDVTKGMQHYGSGGTYDFFTGIDGSRAYSTGHFTEEGLTDDLSGLKTEQIGEIYNWINIFGKKYPSVGRLEGPFFTAAGLPTSAWRDLEESLLELGEAEEAKRALYKKYPSCNSHYDNAEGKAEVWCTVKSGGVTRDWVGFPRQLHLPGQRVRCACVQESLLEDPKLKEYPECAPSASSCKLKL